MSDVPRVLITVNPGLLAGQRFSTIRSLVTAVDRQSNLSILPIDGYDFKKKRVRMYRRVAGGRFEFERTGTPQADLWVVYTDGYYLNFKEQGFSCAADYIKAQMEFHETWSSAKPEGCMVNSVAAERHTLKRSFAVLNAERSNIIKTYVPESAADLTDLMNSHKILVAKPNWSGGGQGVEKLTSQTAAARFAKNNRLADFCFQPFVKGEEKRLWFAGDKCVAARTIKDRKAPWMDSIPATYRSRVYDRSHGQVFKRDLAAAEKLWKTTGLQMGSVDFIGDRINELNGCGTTYIDYDGWIKIVDARKHLVDFVLSLVQRCR